MKEHEFFEVIRPVAELVDAKDRDYNAGVPLEEYFPFGHKSYIHMLHTKVLRLMSLVKARKQPSFESLEDTVNDLIAYAVFYKAYLQAPAGPTTEDNDDGQPF